jgi:hypothetical protein
MPFKPKHVFCALQVKMLALESYVQADWTLTHTSHRDTEQSTTEAFIRLDGVTLTDSLIS